MSLPIGPCEFECPVHDLNFALASRSYVGRCLILFWAYLLLRKTRGKSQIRGGLMSSMRSDSVLTSDEAIQYLRISKPTFLKYIRLGRIKAIKAGKGWRVLHSELYRFLREGPPNGVPINADLNEDENTIEINPSTPRSEARDMLKVDTERRS